MIIGEAPKFPAFGKFMVLSNEEYPGLFLAAN
jgi:hypothetical protein